MCYRMIILVAGESGLCFPKTERSYWGKGNAVGHCLQQGKEPLVEPEEFLRAGRKEGYGEWAENELNEVSRGHEMIHLIEVERFYTSGQSSFLVK